MMSKDYLTVGTELFARAAPKEKNNLADQFMTDRERSDELSKKFDIEYKADIGAIRFKRIVFGTFSILKSLVFDSEKNLTLDVLVEKLTKVNIISSAKDKEEIIQYINTNGLWLPYTEHNTAMNLLIEKVTNKQGNILYRIRNFISGP